jgi:lysophospholipase L1-like esterase
VVFTARSWRRLIAVAVIVILAAVAAKALHLRSYIVDRYFSASIGPGSVAYSAQVLEQSRRSQQIDDEVLFFGDSITAALPMSNISARSENFGIVADTVEGLTGRLSAYRLAGNRAVVLAIGVNNLPDGLVRFEEKYRTLLALIPQSIPIIAVAITPVGQSVSVAYKPPGYVDAIRKANGVIDLLCRTARRCQFLDLFQVFEDGNGLLQSSFDAGDGLHLSAAAYAVWIKKLNDLISRL